MTYRNMLLFSLTFWETAGWTPNVSRSLLSGGSGRGWAPSLATSGFYWLSGVLDTSWLWGGHTAASAVSHVMVSLFTCVQSSLFLCVECARVCSQACGDQKSILVSSSVILHLAFGGRLSINPEFTDLTRFSGQLETVLPVILHLLGLQARTIKPNLCVGAEDLNSGLYTVQQVPYQLSHLPRPPSSYESD